MSSKLTKKPKPYTIVTPYPEGDVKLALTIFVMADSRVELWGPVDNRAVAGELLECGAKRLVQYHQQKAKPASGLVGIDGQPLPARDS